MTPNFGVGNNGVLAVIDRRDRDGAEHMEQLFKWGIESGSFGFILITNELDWRARVRLNGNQNVVGIN